MIDEKNKVREKEGCISVKLHSADFLTILMCDLFVRYLLYGSNVLRSVCVIFLGVQQSCGASFVKVCVWMIVLPMAS